MHLDLGTTLHQMSEDSHQFLFCWFLFFWFLFCCDVFALRLVFLLGCDLLALKLGAHVTQCPRVLTNYYSTDFYCTDFYCTDFYSTDFYCAVTFLHLDLCFYCANFYCILLHFYCVFSAFFIAFWLCFIAFFNFNYLDNYFYCAVTFLHLDLCFYHTVTFLHLDLDLAPPINQCERVPTNFYSADFDCIFFAFYCILTFLHLVLGDPSQSISKGPHHILLHYFLFCWFLLCSDLFALRLVFIAFWPFCT